MLLITRDGFKLATATGLLKDSESISTPLIPKTEYGYYDFKKLNDRLYDLKIDLLNQDQRYTDIDAIIITAETYINFETVLLACQALSLKKIPDGTEHSLFPNVSFGIVIEDNY